jgi:hypothetical protein
MYRCACQLVAGLLERLGDGEQDADGLTLLDALFGATGILQEVALRLENAQRTLEGWE